MTRFVPPRSSSCRDALCSNPSHVDQPCSDYPCVDSPCGAPSLALVLAALAVIVLVVLCLIALLLWRSLWRLSLQRLRRSFLRSSLRHAFSRPLLRCTWRLSSRRPPVHTVVTASPFGMTLSLPLPYRCIHVPFAGEQIPVLPIPSVPLSYRSTLIAVLLNLQGGCGAQRRRGQGRDAVG